jgi:hypothetical protein
LVAALTPALRATPLPILGEGTVAGAKLRLRTGAIADAAVVLPLSQHWERGLGGEGR